MAQEAFRHLAPAEFPVQKMRTRFLSGTGALRVSVWDDDFFRVFGKRRDEPPKESGGTHNGKVNLDHLVRSSGLSQRRFERTFTEHADIAPKLYCRINRLSYALRLKENRPDRTWTDVTYQTGTS